MVSDISRISIPGGVRIVCMNRLRTAIAVVGATASDVCLLAAARSLVGEMAGVRERVAEGAGICLRAVVPRLPWSGASGVLLLGCGGVCYPESVLPGAARKRGGEDGGKQRGDGADLHDQMQSVE